MANYNFMFDANRCIGCSSCEVACKKENEVAIGPRWRKVTARKKDGEIKYFVSMACNHCKNPVCWFACPLKGSSIDDSTGAIYREPNYGALIINNGKQGTPSICNGCRKCEWACPYGAPKFNTVTKKAEKCHLCVPSRLSRTDLNENPPRPACVATCVGRALNVTDDPSQPYKWSDIPAGEQKVAEFTDDTTLIGVAFKKRTTPSLRVRPRT